jgi:hypothetical protein
MMLNSAESAEYGFVANAAALRTTYLLNRFITITAQNAAKK